MSRAGTVRLIGFATAIAAAGSLSWILPSAAANTEDNRTACGQEIRTVCPWRFTPDSISFCVQENRALLSTACQVFWDTARQCQEEMREICGGLNPFTIRSCLAERQEHFSATCRATLDLQ